MSQLSALSFAQKTETSTTTPMEMKTMKYLTEKQVSELTGLALPTLRNDRFLGRRLPYVKFGKAVRYNEADVVGFMEDHKIRTSNDGFVGKSKT
jgi:predicted DNA-binding transcriptional regulator AlpA